MAIGAPRVIVVGTDAISAYDDPVDPQTVDRSLSYEDRATVEGFVERYLPEAGSEVAGHVVCMYTCTPSNDFLIDRHPEFPQVVVAGGFSGHGFKFAPAVGRLVGDLTLAGSAPHPDFSFERHRGGGAI